MIPMEHPWVEWQEEVESDELYSWRWKDNTPKEIIEQYLEWKEYCENYKIRQSS